VARKNSLRQQCETSWTKGWNIISVVAKEETLRGIRLSRGNPSSFDWHILK